jgi:hypothetical protein
MRHSGRAVRPPGSSFPEGFLPDLWGFGSSHELEVLVQPPGRRDRPAAHHRRPRTGPVAAILERIGKLFG